MAEEKSSRHKLADRLAQVVRDSGYNNPYGGRVFLTSRDKRKYYSIGFSYLNSVAGSINVYEDNFIQIEYRSGKMTGDPVFENENRAIRFFKTAIVSKMWEKSKKIPHKPPKSEE